MKTFFAFCAASLTLYAQGPAVALTLSTVPVVLPPQPGLAQFSSQQFQGSVPTDRPVRRLFLLQDAIDRGLKTNLGLVRETGNAVAQAERRRALSVYCRTFREIFPGPRSRSTWRLSASTFQASPASSDRLATTTRAHRFHSLAFDWTVKNKRSADQNLKASQLSAGCATP